MLPACQTIACQRLSSLAGFPRTHPPGGPHKRWKDQIRKDLKSLGVSEAKWYDEANHSRDEWRAIIVKDYKQA